MPSATIAAIATGTSRAGIGVVRISGPSAFSVGRALVPGLANLKPRVATFARFVVGGSVIDEGLALFFQGPHSFTGEDVVELQAHGSPLVLRALLRQAIELGARLAEPGEFTRRAVLNGRLDLVRAEATVDLIEAESEAGASAAARQLSGELSKRLAEVRRPLLELHADLEGALDFPEESDGAELNLPARLAAAQAQLSQLVAGGRSGVLLKRGAQVVLYGPVNAGKSTLFNRLVGADRALVDAEPGTTRDLLEASVLFGRLPVTLFDSAGLRAEPGRLEALGIERARAALSKADLAVLVLSPDSTADEVNLWRSEVADARRLEVSGKADLGGAPAFHVELRVSGATGVGVDALRAVIERRLGPETNDVVLITSERQLGCLHTALESVDRAQSAAQHSTLEVVAGEVGLALRALADITGEDVSAELLDTLFARFCIGK